MKFVKLVLFLTVFSIVSLYVALFTPLSKTIIVPSIESEISKAIQIQNVEIPTFELSTDSLKIKLLVENQIIEVDATFDIFAKTVDLTYNIDIADLSKFNDIAKQRLSGTFKTNGTVKGQIEKLDILGDANVANGNIKYSLSLVDNKPQNIKANISKIDLPTLLSMINQPKFIDGKFDSTIDVSSLDLDKIKINANVNNGKFIAKIFQNELNITIPNSNFTLNTNVNLQNKSGKFVFDFDSSLIKLLTNGNVDLNSLKIDSKYKVSIDKLAILEPIIQTKLNGSFATNGTIKGDKKSMRVIGSSNIASSKTIYDVVLKDMKVDTLKANIKNAKVEKLLHIVNQPSYAKADLNLDININSLTKLDGKITTSISSGLLNKDVIKKDFNISLPSKATFSLKATTKLAKNIITTKSSLNTFAANINMNKTIFDTETSTLSTDYKIDVPKLSKLYFITEQKMRGDATIVGDIKYKDNLTLSFNSKKFNGDIKGTLKNDILKVKMNGLESVGLLNMLYYSELYDSKINLDLDYNTKTKIGTSSLVMNDGKFLANKMSKTIKSLIQKDLTTEIYEIAKVDTKIDNQKLNSTLYMTSKNSKIVSKSIFIDLEKDKIKSDISLEYHKYKVEVKLRKKLSDPDVSFDTNDLIKDKAKEKLTEALEKELGDKLDGNTKKVIGGFLQKLF